MLEVTPAVAERIVFYLAMLERAGCSREAIYRAEGFFTQDHRGLLVGEDRELTEEEQLFVIDQIWVGLQEELSEGEAPTQDRGIDLPLPSTGPEQADAR